MEEAFFGFLGPHKLKFLTVHLLAIAMGLGGATISDIMFFRFLKDYRISKKEHQVLNLLKSIVLIALGFIILSGLAIYLANPELYRQSDPFLAKMILVGILTVNGIALHLWIAPRLLYFNFKHQEKMGRGWYKLAFGLGAVSATSWYSVFLIAMFKYQMNISLGAILGYYFAILSLAIVISQFFERYYDRKANKK